MADIYIDPNLLTLSTSCALCKQVEKKLGYDIMNLQLKTELFQTNENVKKSMLHYFKNYLISDRIQKYIGRKTIGNDSGFGNSLLGKQDEEEKDELNKFVGKEIEEFCFKITKYSHTDYRYPNNRKKAFKQAVDDLRQQKKDLDTADKQIKDNQANINRMLLMYYMGLKKGISMLQKLVSLYKTKLEFEFLLKDFYSQRCNGIVSKVKRFELEILKATYFQKSILALNKISSELDEKKKQLEIEKNQINVRLQDFSVLGPDYDKIVKEYIELCRAIKEQQWTLDALARTNPPSSESPFEILQETHIENKSADVSTKEHIEECSKEEDISSSE